MELASRVFDVVTASTAIADDVRPLIPEAQNPDEVRYWRRVLRMAALCHDIGHLPFSHAAEDELLPAGWSHERLTRMLIESELMMPIWKSMRPPLEPEHIVKLALGVRKAKDLTFSKWEAILSDIIVGDSFGVDRIDYLLRDSHHTGVGYGKFDHYKLIDEIRILPSEEGSTEPALGINEGGIYSAEALTLARYFMFTQVYYHPIRLIYDRHLMDFLKDWLAEGTLLGVGTFSVDVEGHLRLTDNEVNAAIRVAASDSKKPGHDPAKRILEHNHFRVLYERNPQDVKVHFDPGAAIADAAIHEFGAANVRTSKPRLKNVSADFPVRTRDERIEPAISMSDVLKTLRPTSIDYVYIEPLLLPKAVEWLDDKRSAVLKAAASKEEEDK
jgi:HD superfamily phosphohydrolase